MLRRTAHALVALSLCGIVLPLTATSAQAYEPPTALLGDGPKATPLKNKAMVQRTDGGLRYVAGQQNSNLTVTFNGTWMRFLDTGTQKVRSIPRHCLTQPTPVGINIACRLAKRFQGGGQMYVEIWPRLGNDTVNTTQLPARFRSWVLVDAGHDTVRTGAGDDFVNGAAGNDRVWGGAGQDWIRTGTGNDELYGEDGDDKLVGVTDNDLVSGGPGNDRVYGGPGSDRMSGDEGQDHVVCGTGVDTVYVDDYDSQFECESVNRVTSGRVAV